MLSEVALPNFKRINIGAKTVDCVFIGYAQNSAAYKLICLNYFFIIEYRDVVFFKDVFTLKNSVEHVPLHVEVPFFVVRATVSSSSCANDNVVEIEPRRSKRYKTETSYGPDFIIVFVFEVFHCNMFSEKVVSTYLIEEDPKTYQEAMESADASFFLGKP